MVNLIAENHPQEIELRHVAERFRPGKKLNRLDELCIAESGDCPGHSHMAVAKRREEGIPRLRRRWKWRLRRRPVESDRGALFHEALLDHEHPSQLPRILAHL